ncbi:MAG: tRNA (guanosine(46)-N7)-methyltransferase TrmB [Gammaproteobacteria bacterium]|nr:tRNA (guanosine(46)-N7)-methyltransferase TrmB [Gammaproteobacteria bacterium]
MAPSSESHSTPLSPDISAEIAAPRHRPIRTFVRREGRLTAGQRHALDHLWSEFGLPCDDQLLQPETLFGRVAPLILEIGYGNGESLLTMAQESPDCDYIGIEVHRPGVGHLLLQLQQEGLTNVRSFCGDGVEILQRQIPLGSLDRVQLFFPDPWHKKRHHKRRMVQKSWVELVAARLKPGGLLHIATDWEPYARHISAVMSENPSFDNCAEESEYSPRPPWRPVTKFERRGERLGHEIYDLIYRKEDNPKIRSWTP